MAEGEDMSRFSDDELRRFLAEFQLHVKSYEERIKTDDERHKHITATQDRNSEQLANLIHNTKEIVDFYQDIKGAARVGIAAQKFGLWLAKWGVIGAMFTAAGSWCIKHFPPGP